MSSPTTPEKPAAQYRGALVATLGISLIALIGVLALVLTVNNNPMITAVDTVAIMGAVFSPLAATVAAYYGVSVASKAADTAGEAVKSANESTRLANESTQSTLHAMEANLRLLHAREN